MKRRLAQLEQGQNQPAFSRAPPPQQQRQQQQQQKHQQRGRGQRIDASCYCFSFSPLFFLFIEVSFMWGSFLDADVPVCNLESSMNKLEQGFERDFKIGNHYDVHILTRPVFSHFSSALSLLVSLVISLTLLSAVLAQNQSSANAFVQPSQPIPAPAAFQPQAKAAPVRQCACRPLDLNLFLYL